MMMLLHYGTVCIPSNQNGLDSMLSNQAELYYSVAHASRSSLAVLEKNTKINVTKSLENYREASIPFSLKVAKYQMGRHAGKR